MADSSPDAWADLAADIRRGRASAIEQAEAWQARAEKAEARVAELEAAVSMLRVALDPLVSAGCRLPDTGNDDLVGYVRVTDGQARAAYRAYLATRSEGHA